MTIVKQPPALAAACDALRGWLTPPPDDSQDKCLLLRYGEGGVNWAHQDQAQSPWQAVLLLNPPTEYEGGALYIVDAAEEPLKGRRCRLRARVMLWCLRRILTRLEEGSGIMG